MRNATHYRGTWLKSGSVAKQLHDDGKLPQLDKHLKQLDADYLKLHGAPAVTWRIGDER